MECEAAATFLESEEHLEELEQAAADIEESW